VETANMDVPVVRVAAAIIVLLLLAGPVWATEPTTQDVTIGCDTETLSVFVGDHEVGHASYLVVGVNPQTGEEFEDWTEIHLTRGESTWPVPPGTNWVTLWVVLDDVEVDPTVDCATRTPEPTTTTVPPVSSTTTTTLPPTTTTVPPVTTTTTLPPCPPPDATEQPWYCVNTGPTLNTALTVGGLFVIAGVTILAVIEQRRHYG
jgi:hypothetical protein